MSSHIPWRLTGLRQPYRFTRWRPFGVSVFITLLLLAAKRFPHDVAAVTGAASALVCLKFRQAPVAG